MNRAAIIQFGEETNTFVPGQPELSDLIPNGWVPAQQVEAQLAGTKTYIGGALAAIRACFAPIADGIVTADTPGLRPANIKMPSLSR